MRELNRSFNWSFNRSYLFLGEPLEVLLEVEAFAVDEDAAHGAALVLRPVVNHVLAEVLKGVEGDVALGAVHRPVVVLHLVPLFSLLLFLVVVVRLLRQYSIKKLLELSLQNF